MGLYDKFLKKNSSNFTSSNGTYSGFSSKQFMQSKKKDFEEEMEEIQKIFLIELYLAHCFFFLFIKITSVILQKTSLFHQYKSCKIIFLKIAGFCENKKNFFSKK